MKKYFALFLAVIFMFSIITGCSKDNGTEANAPQNDKVEKDDTLKPSTDYATSVDDIVKKGKLVIGLDDTFAPMGFRDESNTLVGFDIDLANAVCEKLGVKAEFQPINWDAKEMELNTGNIDCIWNGMSITPEREKNMNLSKPYLNNKIIIMTNEGVEIKTKEDLIDKQIGIQQGSAALEAVQSDELYEKLKENVVEYPTYDEVILDMKAGRLDCMIIDEIYGSYKNTKIGNIYGIAEPDFGDDLYAIGFRKGDVELTDKISETIKQLVQDGTAKEISEKWFGANIVLD